MTKKIKKLNTAKITLADIHVIRFLLWFLSGFVIGIIIPWYFYLQSIINNLFIDYNWSIPTSIYARELTLFADKQIVAAEVDYELKVLGYKKRAMAVRAGEYSV
ncbi:MAG TPA: hypothetical protein ENJ41_06815, partial [Oceanospirillales bacterium]|nr:hypothetical protein [Oceanospirillales bacterium]